MNNPLLGYDDQIHPPEPEDDITAEPYIRRKPQHAKVFCVGCNEIRYVSLFFHAGERHFECTSNDVVGYWAEYPQEVEYEIVYPNGLTLPLPDAPEEPQMEFEEQAG